MLDITLQNNTMNPTIPIQRSDINRESVGSGQMAPANQIDLNAQAGPAYQLDIKNKNNWYDPEIRKMKQTGQIECQTCKERTYQDGSNDPGVSFKAPGHISPENSAAVVQSHEQEHVVNEQASARNEGRKVVSQSVRIYSAVCPECGKVYVAGGETRTTTATDTSQQQNSQIGAQVDMLV